MGFFFLTNTKATVCKMQIEKKCIIKAILVKSKLTWKKTQQAFHIVHIFCEYNHLCCWSAKYSFINFRGLVHLIIVAGLMGKKNTKKNTYPTCQLNLRKYVHVFSHFSLLPLLLWLHSPSGLVLVGNSSSSSSTVGQRTMAKVIINI